MAGELWGWSPQTLSSIQTEVVIMKNVRVLMGAAFALIVSLLPMCEASAQTGSQPKQVAAGPTVAAAPAEMTALLAMGECRGTFKPLGQATPADKDSGAVKLVFNKGDDGSLKVGLEWDQSVAAYNNPASTSLAFPRKFSKFEVSLAGTSLGLKSPGSSFDLQVTTAGATKVSGTYKLKGDDRVYDLSGCTRR